MSPARPFSPPRPEAPQIADRAATATRAIFPEKLPELLSRDPPCPGSVTAPGSLSATRAAASVAAAPKLPRHARKQWISCAVQRTSSVSQPAPNSDGPQGPLLLFAGPLSTPQPQIVPCLDRTP